MCGGNWVSRLVAVCADEDQPESGEGAAKPDAECGATGHRVFLFGSASLAVESWSLYQASGPGRNDDRLRMLSGSGVN